MYDIDTTDWRLTVSWGNSAVTLEPREAFDVGLDLMRTARQAQRLGVPATPAYHGLPGPRDIGWVEAICLARQLIDTATELMLECDAPVSLSEADTPVVVRIAT